MQLSNIKNLYTCILPPTLDLEDIVANKTKPLTVAEALIWQKMKEGKKRNQILNVKFV